MLLALMLGCPEPPSPPTVRPFAVEVDPLTPCAFAAPGFDPWVPGGDWATQYPEENGRYLYTGGGVGVADLDGDGRLDIFLPGATRAQLFFGAAEGFEERAGALPEGLDRGVGATIVDFDADGDLDLYHTRLGRPNALLRNDGGVFVDVALDWGVADGRKGISSSWGDVEGDGDLDLFVANFGNQNAPRADPNGLYRFEPGGFLDDSATLPADFNEAFTFTGGFVDLDGDGLPELYGVNDFGWKIPNQLLWNRGGVFEADGNAVGLDIVMEGMGLGINDRNGDGVPDLLMASWDDLFFMESAGPLWADSADVAGIGSDVETDRVIGWGSALEDLDNDGDLDALVVNGYLRVSENWPLPAPEFQPESLFVNDGGAFTEVSAAWGLVDTLQSRGFVLVDLDGDGALDLVRRDQRGPAVIHKGRCAGNAVIVSLGQPGANPGAVGARVDLTVDGQVQHRWVRAGTTNFASQGPLEVHFGVGEAERASLEVVWPDGEVHVIGEIDAQQRVHVTRR